MDISEQSTGSVVELGSEPHEPCVPEEVVLRSGIIITAGTSAAVPALTMNRRIRNRTYGGVRGRREQSRLLLDSEYLSVCTGRRGGTNRQNSPSHLFVHHFSHCEINCTGPTDNPFITSKNYQSMVTSKITDSQQCK